MKKLLILSGKGGTGKTTTAAAFIKFSKAKAYGDCDVDAPNLHLAIRQNVEPNEKDFIGGKKARVKKMSCNGCGKCVRNCRFDAINIKCGVAFVDEISCEGCGVCEYICPSKAISLRDDVAGKTFLYKKDENVFSTAELKMGRGNSGKLVSEVKFALFDAAKDEELAIIDGSPGIGCPVIASIGGIDIVLIVAEPTVSGLSDLKRLVKAAEILGARLAVCVNKWDVSPSKTDEIEKFCVENDICFTGKISFDKTVSKIINEGKNIAEVDCVARNDLYNVWCKVKALLNE